MTQHRRSRVLRHGIFAVPAVECPHPRRLLSVGRRPDESRRWPAGVLLHLRHLQQPREPVRDAGERLHGGEPDVTITTNPTPNDKYGETIRTQLQAGNAADVIQTTPGSGDARGIIPLAEAGFLEPLGDTAAGLVPEGSETIFEIDGKVYGQPMDFTIGTSSPAWARPR